MNLEEEIKLERYKLVTNRQKYFTELCRSAFSFYVKIFTGLVAGGITIISAKTKLGIEPALLVPLIKVLVYLVTFLGVMTILQVIFCLDRWKAYCQAERKINPTCPKIRAGWWLFEGLYCIAIVLSILAAWNLLSRLASIINAFPVK